MKKLPGHPREKTTDDDKRVQFAAPDTTSLQTQQRAIAESGLFDRSYYLRANPDVEAAGIDPVEHYVLHGASEGRRPSAEFDGAYYAQEVGIDPAVVNPLYHYHVASPELPSNTRLRLAPGGNPARTAIEVSGLFQADFYLGRHPDVAEAEIDPLDHFLEFGAAEMRWPSPWFNTHYYLSITGLDPRKQNPLHHYIAEGERRGLQPHPDFSPHQYLADNPDVARSHESPLRHYLRIGASEGRSAAPRSTPRASMTRLDLRQLRIAIVIPVFNNEPQLRRCLSAVRKHTRLPQVTVILIDDASTCERTTALMEAHANNARVTRIRSERNQGFTQSVNQGVRLAGDQDVVLLNSDTEVGPRWLEGLALAAYADLRNATATPLSDNAGAFSTPQTPKNATREKFGVDSAARLSQRAAPSPTSPFPTGNGFCMYLRRDAIRDVGEFDVEHFPRGYGEENDFCMRAGERGWRHAIALHSYVAHENAGSFGLQKEALVERGREQLARIHPGYQSLIHHATLERSPLTRQREAFGAALDETDPSSVKPRILYVVSTQTGGTPRTNADLMAGIRDLYQPLLLSCDRYEMILWDAREEQGRELARHTLRDPVRLLTHGSREYEDRIASWLESFHVELLHIRHIAWHTTQLPRIAQSLGIPVVFSFHDFYCVCPSVNLSNGRDTWFPGGVSKPHIVSPLWDESEIDDCGDVDPEDFLRMWRRRMRAMFEACDQFVATSSTSLDILEENFPSLAARSQDFELIPHGRDFKVLRKPRSRRLDGGQLRVLVPGDITGSKGLHTLLRLLELDKNQLLDVHVLGSAPFELRQRTTFHGPYERDAFAERVEAIQPDVALALSIWPETWCHVLTECWAAGLPVIGSRLGALGERIQHSGAGWTVDPNDAASVLEILEGIGRGDADLDARLEALVAWQCGERCEQDIASMTRGYVDLYRSLFRTKRTLSEEAPCLRRRIAVVASGLEPHELPADASALFHAPGEDLENAVFERVELEDLIRSQLEDYEGVLIYPDPSTSRLQRELERACRASEIKIAFAR